MSFVPFKSSEINKVAGFLKKKEDLEKQAPSSKQPAKPDDPGLISNESSIDVSQKSQSGKENSDG